MNTLKQIIITTKELRVVEETDCYVMYGIDQVGTIPVAVIPKTEGTELCVEMQEPDNNYAVIGDIYGSTKSCRDNVVDTLLYTDGTIESAAQGKDAKMINPKQMDIKMDLSNINKTDLDTEPDITI